MAHGPFRITCPATPHHIHTYMYTYSSPINIHKWHINRNIHIHRSHTTSPLQTLPHITIHHISPNYSFPSHTYIYMYTTHASTRTMKTIIRIQMSKTYLLWDVWKWESHVDNSSYGILPKTVKMREREGNKRKQEAFRKDSSLEHRQVLPAGYTLAGVIEGEA